MLVDVGYDISGFDSSDLTPLHLACFGTEDIKLVYSLIQNDTDMNVLSEIRKHCYFGVRDDFFVPQKPTALMECLLQMGANPKYFKWFWIFHLIKAS